jgi:Flp pilus assembly protein TadG
LFLIIFSLTALALASLLIDGGTVLNAEERAADIAQQAARAAANDIDVAALRGGTVAIAADACRKADSLVIAYKSSIPMPTNMTSCTCLTLGGAVVACGARQAQGARVTVSVTSKPVILQAFGSFTKSATETAQAQCGIAARGVC